MTDLPGLPAPAARIIAAVEGLLTERGPMFQEELLEVLLDAGTSLGSDPEGLLADLIDSEATPLIWELPDGREAFIPAILAGRVFTHRVSEREIEHDLLDISHDLSTVSLGTDDPRYRKLRDGFPVSMTFSWSAPDAGRDLPLDAVPDGGALVLPEGTLRALELRPGDLVGVRLTAQGFTLERVVQPAEPPSDLAERLTAILDETDPERPMLADDFSLVACVADPELFRGPLPPLGELTESLGFPRLGDWIAAPGFNFPGWAAAQRRQEIRRDFRLDADGAATVQVFTDLYEQCSRIMESASTAIETRDDAALRQLLAGLDPAPGPTAATGPTTAPGGPRIKDVLERLADAEVASATLADIKVHGEYHPESLALVAELLEPMVPRPVRPALRWLRAKAHEDRGETAKAERALGDAEALDPAWSQPLLDLARYACDRGDAERGLALLRRAGADDTELADILREFRPEQRPDMRRNGPCWCGSGRKYKHCHLGREELPLARRASWLYLKAVLHLDRGIWRGLVVEVAAERARHWTDQDGLLQALEDPLVTDAVLFEGGAFEEFLAHRGDLLPDDERMLAGQWLLGERSVFEVESVEPGKGLRLRDLRTGDRLDVQEVLGSRQLEPGVLVCTRVLPTGEGQQLFGGIEPIPLHHRDELIELLDAEPDPLELVAFLSRRFAPPVLQNTEGEPLVLCEAAFRVLDPDALAQALDEMYDRVDVDEPQWFEYVAARGGRQIRASLELVEDELRVQANSEARFERVIAAVTAARPGVTLIGESRRSIDEGAADTPEPDGPPASIDLTDPQVGAAVAQLMERYEASWLDEPIPALAGATPRQAAADPTRRPDLIRLLDSFPEADEEAITMSPRRLREALGLA